MYPRDGISVLLREHGGRGAQAPATSSSSSAPVVRLERDGDRIARVVYHEDGQEHTLDCDIVLSTLPLPALVDDVPGAAGGDRRARGASCATAA